MNHFLGQNLGVLRSMESHSREALTLRSQSQRVTNEHEECVVAAGKNGGVVSKDFLLLKNSTCFHFLLVIVWEKN